MTIFSFSSKCFAQLSIQLKILTFVHNSSIQISEGFFKMCAAVLAIPCVVVGTVSSLRQGELLQGFV